MEADDARAIVIATSTNLIQRQNLSVIERGKAYKALLDAKNLQGYRSDIANRTSGENRQKHSARTLVAEFFGALPGASAVSKWADVRPFVKKYHHS